MSDELFNPEAFEQMPGQMSMEAVESTFSGEYARAHPTFVANYMNEASARVHARNVGGDVRYVWAAGVDTWEVHRGSAAQ